MTITDLNPSAVAYHGAADRFDDLARTLLAEAAELYSVTPRDLGGVGPGLTDAAIRVHAAAVRLRRAAAALQTTAAICRSRAVVRDDLR